MSARGRAAAVGDDVEAVVRDPVAVGVPGGHEHDRVRRERDAAVLDLVVVIRAVNGVIGS